jgi:DNA-binding PadR family transcriptional regulator
MPRRLSTPTKLVFQTLLDCVDGESYGFQIAQATGLPSGTIYPILRRMEVDGLIEGSWAEVESNGQRRRRRYYALTRDGRQAANAATSEQRAALRMLSPGWSAS